MTEDWWLVLDMNSWQRNGFILDHLEFYANKQQKDHLFTFLMD